jgi:hypothetical protein
MREVSGLPLLAYPIKAALAAETVDEVFLSTDDDLAVELAVELGASVIRRPSELSTSDSEMSDVIKHALPIMGDPDVIVGMHGNCGTHPEGLVDLCVRRLVGSQEAGGLTAVVSVREVQDCHPYRLKRPDFNGLLMPWAYPPTQMVSNNRQAPAVPAYVLDGASRAFLASNLEPEAFRKGQPPFRYLGTRIGFEVNPGGLDVHSESDLHATEEWLWSRSGRPKSSSAA